MKFPPLSRAKIFSFFAALAFAFTAMSSADTPQIDIAKAKAELEKAKAAAAAKETARPAAPATVKPIDATTKLDTPQAKPVNVKEEEKSGRKRLFTRGKKDKEPKEKIVKPEEVTSADAETLKEDESKSSSRRRLFSRNRKDPDPEEPTESMPTEDADKSDEAVTEESTKEGRRRLLSFGRKRDEPAAQVTPDPTPKLEEDQVSVIAKEESEVAQAEPAAQKKERRRLIGGGMFSRSEKDPDEVQEIADVPKKKGGGLFGFGGGDSKDFAKADRTKLGNSVESDASKVPVVVKKKTSSTGELGWYVVTNADVPFYAVGPGQPMPPEKILDRGSMLTVTKGGWGWCNVRLGSGELGVVSSKSMRPATVAEISRHNGSMTASRSRGGRRLFNVLSRGPTPEPALPTSSASSEPIRNFGLLPPVSE